MFSLIESYINDAQQEITCLEGSGIDVSKLKNHYLRSLTMIIVSEYENLIEKIFYSRALKCNDAHVTNYVKHQISNKFRSPDISKINSILGFFDDSLKAAFETAVINQPMHAAWDNLLKARHFIVHKQGSLNLTYEELLKSYSLTQKVIFEIINAIGLQPSDII
jgi:hypothetical protein